MLLVVVMDESNWVTSGCKAIRQPEEEQERV